MGRNKEPGLYRKKEGAPGSCVEGAREAKTHGTQ